MSLTHSEFASILTHGDAFPPHTSLNGVLLQSDPGIVKSVRRQVMYPILYILVVQENRSTQSLSTRGNSTVM